MGVTSDQGLMMSRLDRAVHELRDQFAPQEVPVVSLLGREAEGRRRRLVVLTDHRLLVAGRRTEPVVVLSPDLCTISYDDATGRLRLEDPDQTVVLREVAPLPARLLRDLLRWRHATTPPPTRHVPLFAAG